MCFLAAGERLSGVLDDGVVYLEALLRIEVEHLFHRGQFLSAECRSVDFARVLLAWRWPADDRAQHDQ